MSVGKSVRLFLADGTPGGLLTAEIMNWTGHVMAAPRSELASLLKRPEAKRTGVYVLLGDDPDSLGGTLAYIGEGDDVAKRLYLHARPEDQGGKDFWDRAVVLTSKDANLTKAHARYLESRFITLALQASRAKLDNVTAPSPISLPEADESDMEYFIEQARIVLPVLGVNLLRSVKSPAESTGNASEAGLPDASPVFELTFKKDGVVARAQEIDGEFTVLADSEARRTWVGAGAHNYRQLRETLEQDGVLVPTSDDGRMRFVNEHVFPSVSAAAAVALGRSANGRTEWSVQGTSMTYEGWQQQGIEEAAEETSDE